MLSRVVGDAAYVVFAAGGGGGDRMKREGQWRKQNRSLSGLRVRAGAEPKPAETICTEG